MKTVFFFMIFCFLPNITFGQDKTLSEKAIYNADLLNGTYTNPIIYSDFSDPDVIKVENKYFMTASSFNCIPGLPILVSYDLVNWELINYAIKNLNPVEVYNKVQNGKGIWAPCIRYHNKTFYIYYPDPDFGIFMIKTKNPEKDWSDPILVKSGKGLIDPAPFWDTDGKAYLGYAFAGSRAGIKSVLMLCSMNSEGTIANSDDVLIMDGHQENPTIEGPKIYKKNNYYYIFAPSGGVSTGWQNVMRSKNIFGPYTIKKILHQGKTNVNGPHQGAWVTTNTGEDWFIHFQDKGAFGRIVFLEPMFWKNNWPIIGVDEDGDGIGEPVLTYKKPNVGKTHPQISPPTSDEFNLPKLGLQWQWQANSQIYWGYPSALGYYTLNCIPKSDQYHNLLDVPNVLLQKLPAPNFTATSKLELNLKSENEETGLVILGLDYAYLKVKKANNKLFLSMVTCLNADKNGQEIESDRIELTHNIIYLKVKINENQTGSFFYSLDNVQFNRIGSDFTFKEGKWIGAKIGFVALREGFTNDAGYVKLDWFRISP